MSTFGKPGGWEQHDVRRIAESLSVPNCCGECRHCRPGDGRASECTHPCKGETIMVVDSNSPGRPIWCPLNTSFVRS